ncbi:MAG: head-tail adaptor protein [Tardiphaga sp.]|uniref:head-tail adaptor protein n=1 Tax=Tardiphaga sp. TaxID=1926292 RepID=UPI0019A5368B|nr:head-tail adaptor protein [Tardiphaga sp.]MBC7585876.1 head-tail adaptor protein [Tardiphaga sp.]
MIDAGRLKTRLMIEAPVELEDGQGGVSRSYAPQATLWAAVMPIAARRDVEADADGASVRVRVVLRGGVALTLQHRLRDGARLYRIVSFRDIDDGRFVEIEAEWRID